MRFLDFELYNKICFENSSQDIDEWNIQYELWQKEFKVFSKCLPDVFVSEFKKKFFHNFTVCDIGITSDNSENEHCLNMTLCEKDIRHYLKFYGVSFVKLELEILRAYGTEWLMCEIGKVDNDVNFVAILLSGGELELKFNKLEYSNTKK